MYKLKGMTITELAMVCKHASGICHRYKIENVTPKRVKISYSNPDEYGYERPIYAYFPIVHYSKNNDQGTIACLEFGHFTGKDLEYQAFDQIRFASVNWNKEKQNWIVEYTL